ncbi:ShlB/FhaC/HecB family hemolysin secretion/activation protein [Vagococcus sp. WN89Y]|uniref:ShlB/FhaC/HecB family hemolysin secretion/activation protein n=1 Tax=Vagococcus sp. WN89Y TaxID=3457258 RepID=UPI003FCEE1C9
MKIFSPFFMISTFLFLSFRVIADTQLNQLIKEQQRNDRNIFRENNIKKKDIFSSAENKNPDDMKLPEEDRCYVIKKLVIENDFLDNSITDNMKRIVEGRCLGVQGIEAVAALIQDYFINAGFITTRVETPSQDLLRQQLVFRVIPGRIENVVITNHEINGWILPFTRGDILNIRNVEQGLENIQKTPGVNVKINIVPGERQGYSNIVIDTNRTTLWDFHTAWNNWGDESTGRQLLSATTYLYNVTKLNDIFYLAGTTSATRNYKNFSAYYSVPIGYWEYELFYSQSKSQQPIYIADLNLNYTGNNKYLSVKGSRTLYRDSNKKVTGSAEFLRRKSTYTLDDIELALQKRDMGNIRLAVNYKEKITDGVFDSTFLWQRFLTLLGGKKTPDMISGDVNTQSQIWSLYAHYLKWITLVPYPIYYEANIGTQYSKHALTIQDQFAIGNRWTVRGFENSSGLDGNRGFFLRNTLGFITGYKDIELYLGTDYGQTYVDGYSFASHSHNRIMGMAVGIKGLIMDLAYDFSVTAPVIYPQYLDVDKLMVNFNFSYQL